MTRSAEHGPRGLLQFQLDTRPVLNRAVTTKRTDDGGMRLSIELNRGALAKLLGSVLPLSSRKNVELDPLGAEILSRCDGECTVGDLIEQLEERWKLSFFEARGLVLQFLRDLMRRNIIVLAAPGGDDEDNAACS